MRFGRQLCGDLDQAAAREWLVTDGLGGYASGTVAGLSTRRYHGLLAVSHEQGMGRRLGLVALDPVLVVGDRRLRLATSEWSSGAVDPDGFVHLESFELAEGVPTWRWSVGDVVLERTLAMAHGRPAVGVVHRLVRSPDPVRVELGALCTWRSIHRQRLAAGPPRVENVEGGFVFEDAYRVRGPGWTPDGTWYRGALHRADADRGMRDREDLFFAGTFGDDLVPGESAEVVAWGGALREVPPPASDLVDAARSRARSLITAAKAADEVEATLVRAADQFVVRGPAVVAGYPWFGDWSRDTMTAYEGLFLETGRADEGRALLARSATLLSEGMLPNTADLGETAYNTADATLWFAHAVGRHVDVTGDTDLGVELAGALADIVGHHVGGTRYGLRADPADGLLAQGEPGVALTWMDARLDHEPVTRRAGKAVEVNALWIETLEVTARLGHLAGRDTAAVERLASRATASFRRRFPFRGRLLDVVDVPGGGDDHSLRPNQLLAVSLPHGPVRSPAVVDACARTLLTSLGLRTLDPADRAYRGRGNGGMAERDAAAHQGSVWPWLLGPYVEAAVRVGRDVTGVLDGLEAQLTEWGLGSVGEIFDGDPPHAATGCPFQAWSVAEHLRARRLIAASA